MLLGPRTINVNGSRRASTPSTVLLCTVLLLMLGIVTDLPIAYIAVIVMCNQCPYPSGQRSCVVEKV